MTISYVTVTGSFDDGSGAPVGGTAAFTPSATVYASSGPLVFPELPVQALISGGQLQALDGSQVKLLATDNEVTVEGQHAPGFTWTVDLTVSAGNGTVTDSWEFTLPSSPDTVDLYSTRTAA